MRKLIQEVRCSRCKRTSEVDVTKSKDPFQPIGQNWTCGKPDCHRVGDYVETAARFNRTLPSTKDIANAPPKPTKYHNEPTEVDGIRFASKKEANRYAELKMM